MRPERKKHYAVLDHNPLGFWPHGLRPLCREKRYPTMVLTKEETTCHICLHWLKVRRERFAQYVKGVYR